MFSVCSVDYSVATLEILEEIFFKEWPEARNYSITYESKSLTKILDENALEYLAFREGFYGGSPYRLEFLEQRE